MDSKSTEQVLAELVELINSKGYIYSLCLIIFEDSHVNVKEIHTTNHKLKLLTKELTLILGFLVKKTIDFTPPDTPEILISMKDKTYQLMQELQDSFTQPLLQKLAKKMELAKDGVLIEDTREERIDFFIEDGGMVEPIFYSGNGIYAFQYLEYLEKRYKYDKEWLWLNKCFDVGDSIKLVEDIKNILDKKASFVNLIGFKEKYPIIDAEARKMARANSVPENEIEVASQQMRIVSELYQYISLFPPIPQPSKQEEFDVEYNQNWKTFYDNILNLFIIDTEDLENNKVVSSFLKNFSFIPSNEINKNFVGPGTFNILNSNPLIQINDNKYFIPLTFLLAEAVYESPFYWMSADKEYRDKHFKHRGDVGEEMTYDLLSQVFGKDNTYKSLRIVSSKGHDVTDIDVLCVLGNRAICIQVKSKKLTLSSRRGDTENLVKDFKGAVQDAYEQGIISRNAILGGGVKFYDDNNNEIKLLNEITEVYIMSLTTDNYHSLAHQARVMLKKDKNAPYPIVLTIFDLELLVHYLKDPFDFLYYIRQRISLTDDFIADEEMVYLGYHLKHKLWKNDETTLTTLNSDYGYLIDRNYFPYKMGVSELVSDETDPIKNLWKNESFDSLCSELKKSNDPLVTNIIFHLLDWSSEGRDDLVKHICNTRNQTQIDGQLHSMSTSIFPDFGVSYISFASNNLEDSTNMLLDYSMARKYRSKCNAWLGLGSLKNSSHMIDIVVYSESIWEFDSELDEFSKSILSSRNKKLIPLTRKFITGDEPCVCGSGKSYNECCR